MLFPVHKLLTVTVDIHSHACIYVSVCIEPAITENGRNSRNQHSETELAICALFELKHTFAHVLTKKWPNQSPDKLRKPREVPR